MAVGTQSDFIIYEDEFFAGAYEVIEQNVQVFNGPSRGSLRLITDPHRGDWRKRSFFQTVSGGLISRRDPSTDDSVTSAKLAQDDAKEPKCSRRIGPVENTLSSFKKIDEDPRVMSFILGQQTGPEMFQNHVNTAIMAVEAALEGVSDLSEDDSSGTITTNGLIDALAKMGDQAARIVAWVMHSKVFYDLVKEQKALNVTDISSVNIMEGMPITMNRPVIVTDSSSLYTSGTTTQYSTLGLVADAVMVRESEAREIVTETITGRENLNLRIQGEYAVTVGVKGFDFTGSANPTDAALASSGNWSQVASDVKSCAGVRLLTS